MTGSVNRRSGQPEGAHPAGESCSAKKQQTNPPRATRIRFNTIPDLPDSLPRLAKVHENEGRTECNRGIYRGAPGSHCYRTGVAKYLTGETLRPEKEALAK